MVLGLYYISKIRPGAKGEGLTFYGPEEAIIAHNEGKCDLHAQVKVLVDDIVDGKQRLDAIRGFVTNEYPDLHGNYFSDLSEYARRKFEDFTSFCYAELDEDATDADVIRTFLNVNFTGVKMSKEHIDFVKEINNKL